MERVTDCTNSVKNPKRERVRSELARDANRSDRAIGRACQCSHYLVASVRQSMFGGKTGRSIRGGFVMGPKGEAVHKPEPGSDASRPVAEFFATIDAAKLARVAEDALRVVPDLFAEGHYESALRRLTDLAELARVICVAECPNLCRELTRG